MQCEDLSSDPQHQVKAGHGSICNHGDKQQHCNHGDKHINPEASLVSQSLLRAGTRSVRNTVSNKPTNQPTITTRKQRSMMLTSGFHMCVHRHACTECTHVYTHIYAYAIHTKWSKKIIHNSINKPTSGNWRDVSEVESTDCPFRGPRFNSQHPHDSSQLSVTPISDTFTQTYMQAKHQCT
jgi:hypothetical protein